MKRRFIISLMLIVTLVVLLGGTTYAWLIYEISISKSIVMQNGYLNDVDISLYRGYDYDLNGTLDLRTDVGTDLDKYYINITNSNNDRVVSIMESSIITYRIVFTNSSDNDYYINPYFFFEHTFDDTLYNDYKSILFRLNRINIITNPGLSQTSVEEVVNRSLCFYNDKEIFKKNILLEANGIIYVDFTLKASNLTEINNDLIEYLTYSQNHYYDLSKGLYTNISPTLIPCHEITDGITTISLTNGIGNGYVNLAKYSNNDYPVLYTSDYVEFDKVYRARQEAASSTTSSLFFILSKICFDITEISGDDTHTIMNSFNNVDMSLYTYEHEGVLTTDFYNEDGIEITDMYDMTNGLYSLNGNKIYIIFDETYRYTLIYEDNIVVKVIKEVIIS